MPSSIASSNVPRRRHHRRAVRVVKLRSSSATSTKTAQLKTSTSTSTAMPSTSSAAKSKHTKRWWFSRRQAAGAKRSRIVPRPPHNTNDYLMSLHDVTASSSSSPSTYASLLDGWTIDPFGSFLNSASPAVEDTACGCSS